MPEASSGAVVMRPRSIASGTSSWRIAPFVAKLACLGVVVLPILSDDTVRQFPTVAHDLGFLLYENWWNLIGQSEQGRLGWLKFNTIEVLIVLTALSIARWSYAEARGLVVTSEHLLAAAFLATVTGMFFWGIATSGALELGLWQVRPYFHMVAIGFLIPQAFRTVYDLKLLIGGIISAICLKAVLAISIFATLAGAEFSGWRELVGHEDSVFFAAAFYFLFALSLYDVSSRRKAWVFTACALLLAALVLNLRRASYAAFAVNAVLLPLILDQRRRRALIIVLAMGGATALYLILFWNTGGGLGVPAQKVRSILAGGQASDYSSGIYRSGENLNLWQMVKDHPLGTGFGKPFDKVFPISDLSSVLPHWDYFPHNTIFGLWMSLGSLGLVVFFVFFSACLTSASFSIGRTQDPFMKSVCTFCAMSLASALIVSCFDQFIWAQRGALFTGAILGLIATVNTVQGRSFAVLGGPKRWGR